MLRSETQDPRPKTQDGEEESKARDKRQEPARQQSKTFCQINCIGVKVYKFCPFGHKKKISKEKPDKDDQQGRPTEGKMQKPETACPKTNTTNDDLQKKCQEK